MEFKTISDILKKALEGDISIRGWLHNKRSSGGIQFLLLRDGTGMIQCTLKKDKVGPEVFESIDNLPIESVVEITGISKKDERSPYGFEISIGKINVLHKAAEDFPIAKKFHGPDFLLNNRHLFLRSKKMQNILRVKSSVLKLAREWFEKNGFTEFHSPILTGCACEGGSTLFDLKYFDTKAYLAQSWQLYAEAGISSLGKIYTVAPSFRAEKSRTRRHLAEYWHLEAEMPFCDMECMIKTVEDFLVHICQNIVLNNRKELEDLGRNAEDLLKVKSPLPRITYEKAIEMLQKDGIKIKWGDDLGADEERALTKYFDVPFFVTHYPKGAKAFYHKPDPENSDVTLSVDVLAPEGYGEIIGSGQREEDYNKLMERIEEEKLDPKDYEWYSDLRKWGTVEHSGFGLGIERFVMWICKLDHIRDAIAFPRLINRIYP